MQRKMKAYTNEIVYILTDKSRKELKMASIFW